MADRWKVDSNHSFGMSLFRDGCEVASGMKKEDAELVAHSMNHYRSVVSSLRRIRFQVTDPDSFTSDEAHQALVDILAGSNDTLKNIGETS